MSESNQVVPAPAGSGGGGGENDQEQAAGPPPRPGGWQMLKTLAIQMVFFYLITSYFRGGSNNNTGPDGSPQEAAGNIFAFGEQVVSPGLWVWLPRLFLLGVASVLDGR